MLTRVSAYIAKQIGSVAFIATLSMCILVTLVQSVKFVDMIVNNGLPVTDFFMMSVLAAPRYLSYLIPIVLFGATLFTYNRMSSDSEIVVLRAAGLSRSRLAIGGIFCGISATLIVLSITLYFMPISQSNLRGIITQARSQVGSAVLKEGQFSNIGPYATMYVREKQGDSTLLGLIYHNSDDDLTIIAERGNMVETAEGPRIIVYNGNKQIRENGELRLLEFKKSTLDIGLTNEQRLSRWREPNERYLFELLFPNLNDANDFQYSQKLIAEGHNRLLTPLFCLTLPLIAMAALLSGTHSRRGQFKQISTAISFMLICLIFHIWLTSAAGKNPDLLYVMYTNAVLPNLISFYFLVGRNRMKRKASNKPSHDAFVNVGS